MWSPTHVQVTVVRASNLLIKGKHGVNDAFVTIGLGKERYQTSVKEKSTDPVQWNEECELSIPKHGNSAEIVLTALHRNFIGDDFLGTVRIPLSEFDVSQYQSTFTKWYPLKNKLGKDNTKKRGELEVKTVFIFKPNAINVGSLSELSKKESHKSSFGQFVGGSLLSLGKEKKSLKKLAKAVGSKVATLPGRGKKKVKDDAFGPIPEQYSNPGVKQNRHEADPGVISDDEDDFRFDELSHKSSHSSLSVSQHVAVSTPKDGSLENLGGGEFLRRTYATPPQRFFKTSRPPSDEITNIVASNKDINSNPIDEWESKLFGRQNQNPKDNITPLVTSSPGPQRDSTSSLSGVSIKGDSIQNTGSPKVDHVPKPRPVTQVKDKVEVVAPSKNITEAPKDPAPLPRQVKDVLNVDAKLRSTSFEDLSPREDKQMQRKEKSKSSTLASLFSSSSKLKLNEDVVNSKGNPVGITTPIRVRESQAPPESRLPRETLKKFDGKSRDELIEMVVRLQEQLEEETEVNRKIRKYMDGVLARVIDTSPTILQVPYISGNNLSMKSGTWDF